jgi:apolipoprotein N-acyltransferase
MPWLPGGYEHIIPVIPTWLIVVGVPLLVLGIIAIAGGVSAIRRKKFGLSLAGAICALPSFILGILAVIFVSLGKREFGAERKENGI